MVLQHIADTDGGADSTLAGRMLHVKKAARRPALWDQEALAGGNTGASKEGRRAPAGCPKKKGPTSAAMPLLCASLATGCLATFVYIIRDGTASPATALTP